MSQFLGQSLCGTYLFACSKLYCTLFYFYLSWRTLHAGPLCRPDTIVPPPRAGRICSLLTGHLTLFTLRRTSFRICDHCFFDLCLHQKRERERERKRRGREEVVRERTRASRENEIEHCVPPPTPSVQRAVQNNTTYRCLTSESTGH